MKETKEMKKLGRPVNENSKRQIELKMKEELRSKGLIKRGRPVVEGSKNQLKQERKQVLAEQGLLTGERGRPVNPNSARQQRLEMLNENTRLKFTRYISELAASKPKDEPVPDFFVENELRGYLNAKFFPFMIISSWKMDL